MALFGDYLPETIFSSALDFDFKANFRISGGFGSV